MGVIKKQTIKGSIYSYLSVFVGFLATGLIGPNILSTEQVGVVGILAIISAVYSQFSSLGFTKVTERLFPYFRDKEKNHNGFVYLTVLVGLIGFAISFLSFLILKPYIISSNIEKSPLLVEYIWLLVPLIFFRMFFLLLDSYNKMLLDATTGIFLSDLLYRTGNFFLLAAFFLKWINFSQYVFGYVFVLCFPAIYLAVLLIYRKQFSLRPNWGFISPSLRKEMINLSLFGLIIGFSSIVLQNVDTLILNEYFNLSLTGIYTTSFYFGTIILIPSTALGKISSTIIADAWKDNDMATIDDIYYKSSINQLLAGLFIFILLIANLHNVFKVLPEDYSNGEWVIILIALSKLIVSSTGASVQIIGTSHKYKIQAYSMFVLVLLSVAFYIIFIPIFGMTGAALGSLLSISSAALFRVFYLYRNMKLFPYRRTHLKCLGIGVLSLAAGFVLPVIDFFPLDLVVRSSLTSALFIGLSYWVGYSAELNRTIDHTLILLKLKRK